jgi:hypothetical protein
VHNNTELKFLLYLNMKCWNSAFNNAQGSKLITIIVQVGAVKIDVTAVWKVQGAQEKKERLDET